MAMSEMKQKLLLYELARIGFTEAVYIPKSDQIMIQPFNDRLPFICDNGDIKYGRENYPIAIGLIRPIVDRVDELLTVWDNSKEMPFDNLPQFRVLTEYNGFLLAARDGTEHGRGLHFVTWQYNHDHTGVDNGHYTENYYVAKEDFATRAGLVSRDKLLAPERAAEIISAIEYRVENDKYLTITEENELNKIAGQLQIAYPEKTENDTYEQETTISPMSTRENTLTQIQENTPIPTSKTIYGDVQPGDWVIAAGGNDFEYLIGMVTAIDKLGTPDHDTDNQTDDIHVDFTAFDYPAERKTEIENRFAELYGEHRPFEELPLDDVIMAPKTMIRISDMGHDEIERIGNLRYNCESFCACFPGGTAPQSAKHAELIERVEQNLSDYHKSLEGFGTNELIEMASRIAAMSDAHCHLTMYNRFDDDELDFFLQFKNPLEVVADDWYDRRSDLDEMSFTMDNINDHRDSLLTEYPLVNNVDEAIDDMPSAERQPEAENQPGKGSVPPDKTERAADKPATLAEKMQAAQEKVKTQETQNGKTKSQKRGERD